MRTTFPDMSSSSHLHQVRGPVEGLWSERGHLRGLAEQGRSITGVVLIGERVRLASRPHADAVDPDALQVEPDECRGRAYQLVRDLVQSGHHVGLREQRTVAQGMDVGNCVGQIEDPHQLHIGTQHGDPSVVVEREHCVGHDFHTLEVAELSRAPAPAPPIAPRNSPPGEYRRISWEPRLASTSEPSGRCFTPLTRKNSWDGSVPVSVRSTSGSGSMLHVARVAPERPQCFDDLDAGAVALGDERWAGVLACAGGQATQEENGDTVENGIRV